VQVLPAPTVLSTLTEPWGASAMARQRERPKADLARAALGAEERVEDALAELCGNATSGISPTQTLTASPSTQRAQRAQRAQTSRAPPFGVAFRAFRRRCAIRCSSARP
jgi:hypothetical protein